MNIHLIGSMRQFDEDIVPLQKITETLHKQGASLSLDWIAAVKSRRARRSKREEELDWPTIVNANIKAVYYADALIVENSRFNYSSAYQTALALQHNKPVLNLYRIDTPEYNDWPDKFFVSGIDSQLFYSVPYKNNDDLAPIVKQFLKSITPKFVDLDIKVSLDPLNMEYLERKSHESNKSITSIVKDILIEKSREQI